MRPLIQCIEYTDQQFQKYLNLFLKMVDIVMMGAPFFVFALLAGVISKLAGDNLMGVLEIFKGLGIYSLVVFFGLMTMILCIYPFLMRVFTQKTYLNFFKSIAPAQMLAFSTSSRLVEVETSSAPFTKTVTLSSSTSAKPP